MDKLKAKFTRKSPKIIKNTLNQTPAQQLVISVFSPIYFTNVLVETRPEIANLLKYKAIIEDPTVPPKYGYVDVNGLYMTYKSKLITNFCKIGTILYEATPLSEYDMFNIKVYIAIISGIKTVIYVDVNLQYLVYGGQAIDQYGDPITYYISSSIIPNDYAIFLHRKARRLTYFLEGHPNALKSLYVLSEPNCPACNQLYLESLPYTTSGELKIHWTTVSFINSTSRGKVFAIWDGKVPNNSQMPKTALGAWVYNETFFTDESGAISPINNPTNCAINAANKSEDYFIAYIPAATPIILYYIAPGNIPSFMVGYPPDIVSFVASIQPQYNECPSGKVISVCKE